MKTDVSEYIGDSTTAFLTKIGKYINARYREVLRRYDWTQLFNTYTFTTTAALATYPMPNDFEEAWYIYDNTNKKVLWQRQEIGPQNDTTLVGSSEYFTVGEISMKDQPTSASTLSIVSDSSSDNTQTVFVRGIKNGYENTETVTLSGTTPATTTGSYTKILQISKSATSSGVITVTSNSGAVTIAVIPAGQLQARYRIIRFFYIPTASVSMVVRYKRSPLPLVNDYDYPILDIADELVVGATADAWRAKRQFAKADVLDNKFEQMLSLRIFQEEQDRDVTIDPIPYPRDNNYNVSTTTSN